MSQESKERVKAAAEREFVNSLRGENLSPDEIRQKLEEFSATLKVRPLDYEAYAKMPYAEKSFHEFANSAELDKALTKYKDEQKSSAQKKDANISRMWAGQTTEEETAVCKATAEQFLSKYQHFTRIPENSAAIADRMRANNLSPHQLSSFVKAFEELAVEGRLILNGKIAGICEDEMVGGHELRTHKELYRFLRPTSTAEQLEQMKAKKMSADEWKRSRPELQDGVPFVVQQQFFKAAKSLAYFEPEYVFSDENNAKLIEYVTTNKLQFNLTGLRVAFNALKDQLETTSHKTHGQIVTLTEHDPQSHGAPALPDKASLRAKIRNLSSTQLAQFFADNPGARAAVDSL